MAAKNPLPVLTEDKPNVSYERQPNAGKRTPKQNKTRRPGDMRIC